MKYFMQVAVLITLLLVFYQNCSQNEAIHLDSIKVNPTTPDSTEYTDGNNNSDNNGNNTNVDNGTSSNLPPEQKYSSCIYNNEEKPHLWSIWGLKNLPKENAQSSRELCNLIELAQCIDGRINPLSISDPLKLSCNIPWTPQIADSLSCEVSGKTILHGHVVILFKEKYAKGANNCIGQVRTCNNGLLTGDIEYSSFTCGEDFYRPASGSTYDCQVNELVVPDGSMMFLFEKSEPTENCSFHERRCIQGRLKGSNTRMSCRPPQK